MRLLAAIFALLVLSGAVAMAQEEDQPQTSFKELAGRFKTFFSIRQFLAYAQSYNDSPSKELDYIIRYVPDGEVTWAYGEGKTLSDTVAGTITVPVFRITNRSCGTVEGMGDALGWDTMAEALKNATDPDCFVFAKNESRASDSLVFTFAYDGGKWALRSVMRPRYNRPDVPLTSVMLSPIETAVAITDPAAIAFNKPWLDLIAQ